jgi:hypothetical protein
MSEDFRGVVVGSEWIRSHVDVPMSLDDLKAGRPSGPQQGSYTPMPNLADAAIRRSLMYFDRIDWPKPQFDPSDTSKYAVLEEQLLLRRTEVTLNPEQFARAQVAMFPAAHVHVFLEREKLQPERWAFAAVAEDTPWWSPQDNQVDTTLIDKHTIQFELMNVLPVPTEDVEFADILDYKQRRHPELIRMRAFLDELYQEVMRSQDVPHARIVAIDKLDAAISDVARTMRESGLKGKWFSVAVDLILDVAGGWRTGEWASTLTHAPSEFAASVGAGLGLYRFAQKHMKSPISRAGPLAYLARASSEAIIELPK